MRLFTLIMLICLSPCFTAQADWKVTHLDSEGQINAAVKDITFTDDSTVGHLVLEGVGLFKTTDKGQTWEKEAVNFTAQVPAFTDPREVSPEGLEFDENGERYVIGQIKGSNVKALGKEEPEAFETLMHWRRVSKSRLSLAGPEKGGLMMADQDNYELTVAEVADGSADSISWFSDEPRGSQFMDIDFTPEDKGLAVGGMEEEETFDPVIWETSDGGRNWHPEEWDTDKKPTELWFMDETTGFIIGEEGLVMKTTDGGETWNDRSLDRTVELLDVAFMDEQTGVVGGEDGHLMVTRDGGNSWEALLGMVTSDLHSVFLDQNGTIYAGDDAQNVYRSRTPVSIIEPSKSFKISVYPNPTSGDLYISFPDELVGEEVTLKIFDTSGRPQLEREVTAREELQLDLSSLEPGTYILEIEGDHFTESINLVKLD